MPLPIEPINLPVTGRTWWRYLQPPTGQGSSPLLLLQAARKRTPLSGIKHLRLCKVRRQGEA